jgi:histidinol dehydrogenase
MRFFQWNDLTQSERKAVLRRPTQTSAQDLSGKVADLLRDVRERGDRSLIELTERFDKVQLESLEVPASARTQALARLAPATRKALETARDNIEIFHRQQLPRRIELPTLPGVRCFREPRALERVGFYIPGGSAPLPSTVMMLGVPSMIVSNPLRVLCTPPQKDGQVHPVVLAAAELCGIERIFAVGGAQAIAAMAYGTESVPKVDKIFGPGNSWVTEAKLPQVPLKCW